MITEVKKDEIDAVSFYKQAGNINDFFDCQRFKLNLMSDRSFMLCGPFILYIQDENHKFH